VSPAAALLCLLAAATVTAQDTPAPLAAAREARDAGRLDEAIGIYQGLLGTADDADAREGLALTLSWAGRLPESLAAYRELAQRVPERELPARRGAVRVLGWAGRYDEARTEAGSVLERWPEDAETRLLAAQVEGWAGRLGEAARLYEQLLAGDGGNVEARVGLAYVRVWQGRPRDAARVLEDVPAEGHARRDVRLARLAVEQAQGDRAAFWRDLARARQDFPAYPDVRRLDRRDRGERGPHLRLDLDGGSDTDELDRRGGALRGSWPVAALGSIFVEGRAERLESLDVSSATVHTARAGADLAVARGLGLRASAGFRSAPGDAGGAVGAVAVTWDPSPQLSVGAGADHDFAYYTPLSVARDVRLTAFDLGVGFSPLSRVGLRGSYSRARFAPAVGDDQHRDAWLLAARALALQRPFRLDLGVRLRGFRFDRSLPGIGYFNPERFRQAVATVTGTWRRGDRWMVGFDGSLGGQQVGVDAGWDLAGGAALEVTHALGRGWDVQLAAGYSRLSLTSGHYGETTARAGVLWRLPLD
jgi:tetratricopeptide (TPR) repeat protein